MDSIAFSSTDKPTQTPPATGKNVLRLQFRLWHLFAAVSVVCIAAFFAGKWFFAEDKVYPYVDVAKMKYGERRHQYFVAYYLHCDRNRRETYLDFEPFGIVDEVRMPPVQNGVAQDYLGFDNPRFSEEYRLGIPKSIEKRFAELLKEIELSVDVESMPWCDMSPGKVVKRETTIASQTRVRVSRSFCKEGAPP